MMGPKLFETAVIMHVVCRVSLVGNTQAAFIYELARSLVENDKMIGI